MAARHPRTLARLGAVLSTILLAAGARAQEKTPPVTVSVVPEQVSLFAGETATVTVIARNATALAARELALAVLPEPGLELVLREPVDGGLGPGETRTWLADVTRVDRAHSSAAVHLHLAQTWERADPAGTAKAVTLAALAVVEAQATPLEKVVEVTVQSPLKNLQGSRTGRIVLAITNKWSGPLTVESVVPSADPAFEVEAQEGAQTTNLVLGPHDTRLVPFVVKPEKGPGPVQALFQVRVAWTSARGRETAVLTASHGFEVAVLGEALVLLGVPSFFLLPGFLFLTVFLLLWRRLPSTKGSPFKFDKTEFWTLAITLSLIAPWVWGLFKENDYREGYGLGEVQLLWWWSVGLGAILAGAGALVLWGFQAVAAGRAAEKETKRLGRLFVDNEEPLLVLERLAKREDSLVREQVESGGKRLLVLESTKGESAAFCVAPRVLFEFTDDAVELEFTEVAGWDAATLHERARSAVASGAARIRWSDPSQAWPRTLLAASVQPLGVAPISIVKIA